MVDFSKALTNPWVWGAGVVLGVLVMASRGSGSSGGDGGTYDPYAVSYGGAALAASNAAAMEYTMRGAEIAAETSRANSANNLARDLKVLSVLDNGQQVNATVMTANAEIAAGVTKHRIEANTALAIDRGANETRREMIYVAGNASTLGAQLAANIERERVAASLKATTQANKINGDNAFWEGVGNFALSAAKTLLPFFF